jgi:hypothetical protein
MPSKTGIVAILCSDIHLSHKVPTARSVEKDWYEVMANGLEELRNLSSKHNCPVICAGDIFDKWDSPPELINFALTHLPNLIAVPGQHDLPYHNIGDIKKSAYWTLVEAGVVHTLEPYEVQVIHNDKYDCQIHAVGHPWGTPVKPIKEAPNGIINLAVVHDYIWSGKHKYKNAPEEKRVSKRLDNFTGYDALVFGDNHKGFLTGQVLNCGTFFRRKSDEKSYDPMVGLLHSDGFIERHYLQYCQDDKFVDVDEALEILEKGVEFAELIEDLGKLGEKGVDFITSVMNFLDTNGIGKRVRKVILESLENGSK